jgi:hypothetical protein
MVLFSNVQEVSGKGVCIFHRHFNQAKTDLFFHCFPLVPDELNALLTHSCKSLKLESQEESSKQLI